MTRSEWFKRLSSVESAADIKRALDQDDGLSYRDRDLIKRLRRCESANLRALLLALNDRWPDWSPVRGKDLTAEGLEPLHQEYRELKALSDPNWSPKRLN